MTNQLNKIAEEIVNLIHVCELCFKICKSIPIIPGRGRDFLPYYYNLNFTKGILLLHTLLSSKRTDELTVAHYVKIYKLQVSDRDIGEIEARLSVLLQDFEAVFPHQLRHKIAAHSAINFNHVHFASAYITPDDVVPYLEIITKLKQCFFELTNYALSDLGYENIKRQSDDVIRSFLATE